jgi:hypothetical protein
MHRAFSHPQTGLVEFGPRVRRGPADAVEVADLDGDGIGDLVVSISELTDELSVLLGNGDVGLTFQPPLVIPFGPVASLVAPTDFDGDGIPDLAVSTRATSSDPFELHVLLGAGDGHFSPANVDPALLPGAASPIAPADVDGDGVMDLIVPHPQGLGILLGSGAGSFQAPIPVLLGETPPSDLAVADLDADGCPDVIVSDGAVRVLLHRCNRLLAAAIDIAPDDAANRLHPVGLGFTRVALLGSEDFDVSEIVRETLRFGPAGAAPAPGNDTRPRDLNGDGFVDLFVRFPTRDAGIAFGDTEACVSGELSDGTAFEGCDAIETRTACGGGHALTLWLVPLVWLRGLRKRYAAA